MYQLGRFQSHKFEFGIDLTVNSKLWYQGGGRTLQLISCNVGIVSPFFNVVELISEVNVMQVFKLTDLVSNANFTLK